MIKLFVGGFPLDYTEMDLAKLIIPFGDISTIKIVRDRKTKLCKGYAFVEMVSENGARDAVVNLDNEPIGERSLTLKFVEEAKAPPVRKPTTNRMFNKPPVQSEDTRLKRPRKRI